MIYLKAIKLKTFPETSYLKDMPAIRYLDCIEQLEFRKPVTFLAGENGTGKSTLLEAIAISAGLNAEGGSKDHSFFTKESHSELYRHLTPVRSAFPKDSFFLRAESFYNTATYLDESYAGDTGSFRMRYGSDSFHKQSHGESFLSLILNRFEGRGLYLLDEPEAALSPQRQLTVAAAIHELVQKNSQFIIATHSPILLAYPHAEILEFSDSGIQKVDYRETEHYKVMKQFIDAPERMMKYLLEDLE